MRTWLESDEKRIFLIDAIGAFLSFVCLKFVLPTLQEHVGLSVDILQLLSIPALCFLLISGASFIGMLRPAWKYLRLIIQLNLGYAIITTTVLILYRTEVLTLGWIYFLGELVILLLLVWLEKTLLSRMTSD